ncbi:prokaryotic E2 ligase family D protein [Sutcliffiella horikoshii]|uniref:prokaryotic E2 ligase family D protein n=1 Tax=Sutcliffiella horikoshii TaxID=79883 RepID=UPI00203A56C0|nr:prokaryotic E2 ligase family D protein [Sutcliffiella horikoshii]
MKIEITIDSKKLRNLNDYVEVRQEDNGRVTNFQMALDDLLSVFSNASENMSESPMLPRNCIKHTVTTSGIDVYIEVPKQIWTIEYSNNKIDVGFPRLIFRYCLQEEKLKGNCTYSVSLDRIVAVKGKRKLTPTTPIFNFPYSHVDDSGRVCMGGTTLPDIGCISELESMHSLFFNSPFSSDYGAKTTTKEPLWKLLMEDFNNKEFNEDILLPLDDTFYSFFGLGKNDK